MPLITKSETCTGNCTSVSVEHVPLYKFGLPREEASLVKDNNSPIEFMPSKSDGLVVESRFPTKSKHRSTTTTNKAEIDAQVQTAAVPSSETTTICTLAQSVPNCDFLQGFENAVSSGPWIQRALLL